MRLNLREIIEIPGGSVPFSQELDTALLDFPSVRAYTAPITAEGKVVNTAGILTLQGKLQAQMLCVCDRCGGELVIRKDDRPETVRDRLVTYHQQTEPLVDFYRKRGKLVDIPDQGSIEATNAYILKQLEA